VVNVLPHSLLLSSKFWLTFLPILDLGGSDEGGRCLVAAAQQAWCLKQVA